MTDKDYFAHLYDIASHLNKEYSLHSALSKSLEKTAEILNLETGWIWLTEPDNKSVYLAVSHNLPPALKNYPERLSGWCYCIKQYLSDDMEEAVNISEIACSRLQDIHSGTNDLRFHATIPITLNGEKVGLINLLSEESRKLNDQELTILNTIGELVGTCIQRARLQQTSGMGKVTSNADLKRISEGIVLPKLESIMDSLENVAENNLTVKAALLELTRLKKDLKQLLQESNALEESTNSSENFSYPKNPITKRELQVLALIKEGLTNESIGNRLHITERTVKFHITSILSKLNATNRTEAVDIGLKRGLFGI